MTDQQESDMEQNQQDWAAGINEVMGAFVGRPINRDTLSSLIAEIQLNTPGSATLLPSDFCNGEIRVKVEFGGERIVASVTSRGLEVV